jgi:hypothetical protein
MLQAIVTGNLHTVTVATPMLDSGVELYVGTVGERGWKKQGSGSPFFCLTDSGDMEWRLLPRMRFSGVEHLDGLSAINAVYFDTTISLSGSWGICCRNIAIATQ